MTVSALLTQPQRPLLYIPGICAALTRADRRAAGRHLSQSSRSHRKNDNLKTGASNRRRYGGWVVLVLVVGGCRAQLERVKSGQS